MDKFILRFIGWFNFLWRRMDVDVARMEIILSLKLKIDNRRPNPYQSVKIAKKKKTINSATIGTVFISLLMGMGMTTFLYIFRADFFTALSFYFLILVVMLAMTLITDLSAVLMDTRDSYMILSRPVNDRTVLISRLLHIFIHLMKIIVPMCITGIIAMAFLGGIGGVLLLLLQILIAVITTILLVNVVYLLILKVATPTRFKNMITYFQIAFAVLIFGGYEFFLQIIDRKDFIGIRIADYHWTFYTPVVWISSLWKTAIEHDLSTAYLIISVLAVVLPVISCWLMIRYLAPVFNRRIMALQNNAGAEKQTENITLKKYAWYEKLATKIFKNRKEEAGFILGWKLTGRYRDFKMKIYPLVGYMVVLIALFLFSGNGGMSEKLDRLKNGPLLLVMVYMSGLFITMVIPMIAYSDQNKAAWICYVVPLDTPGKFLRGFFKMLAVKYFLPWYAVVALASIVLRGITFVPNLILCFLNILLLAIIMALVSLNSIPFSKEWSNNQNTGRVLKQLLYTIPIVIIALVHYFIRKNGWLVFGFCVLSALMLWWLSGELGKKRLNMV